MNNIVIALLSTFVPIIFIFLVIVIYICIKFLYLKKYSSYLDELERYLESEPGIDSLTALRTVDIKLQIQEKTLIAELSSANNDEININDVRIENISKTKENFAVQTTEIEDQIKKLTSLKEELLDNLEHSRVFSCRKIVANAKKIRIDMLALEKTVIEDTKAYINPILEFENQRYKLEKIIQNIQKSAEKWYDEIQNDNFINNVKNEISKAEDYLNNAISYVEMGDAEKTFSNLNSFKKILYNFVLFENYFKNFKDVLFEKSNETFSKVIDYLNKVKTNLNSDLESLNIDTFIENFNEEFASAKESFYNLDVKKTKENIERYFNTLLGLTHSVTQELNAYNFFKKYGINQIQTLFEKASEKYSNIKVNCEKLLSIDKIFYWNVQNEIDDIETLFKLIKNNIDDYINNYENGLIMFSSKQAKYKLILQQLLTFFNECNNIERSVNVFFNEGVSQGLRYNRLKKIYINGKSDIKEFNIKLTIEDNEIINLIEQQKLKIENLIFKDEISNEKLKDEVDNMFILMKDFVMKVFKKVLIVRAFTLISLDHSYKRLNNSIFNKKVIECEELISEGKYEQGLKLLVNSIKGVNN